MKRLLLLRHAKSDRDAAGLTDHERPLAARGREATPLIAGYLRAQDLKPDLVLCSSAVRTRQTLDLLAPAVCEDTEVEIDGGLYLASAHSLLGRLRAVPDAVDGVLLIGHNPGLQDLAVRLAGSGERRDDLRDKFPTAALAVLTAPLDRWAALDAGTARLTAFVRPRDLPHR